jgi:hypothetical protein
MKIFKKASRRKGSQRMDAILHTLASLAGVEGPSERGDQGRSDGQVACALAFRGAALLGSSVVAASAESAQDEMQAWKDINPERGARASVFLAFGITELLHFGDGDDPAGSPYQGRSPHQDEARRGRDLLKDTYPNQVLVEDQEVLSSLGHAMMFIPQYAPDEEAKLARLAVAQVKVSHRALQIAGTIPSYLPGFSRAPLNTEDWYEPWPDFPAVLVVAWKGTKDSFVAEINGTPAD